MSEILREKQKAEALKRMRLMGLREDFIHDFEENGKVHICTFQKTYPELSAEDTEMVRQFEQKHHALVYLILRVHTILGDLDSLRCAVRERGGSGFVFFNNYVRHYPMGDRKVEKFTPAEGIEFPDFTLKNGQYCIFPFGMDVGGALLRSAEATPFCVLNGTDYVFWAYEGQGSLQTEGTPRGKLIVLSKEEALGSVCCDFDGADRLFCSESEVYAEEGKVVMLCERDARLKIYPAPAKAPCGFRETGREGVFTVYEKAVRPSLFSVSVRRGGAGEKYRDFELEVSVAEDYPHTAWLEIGYEGDRLEIFLDGEKVADDFYTGVPYAFGLRDYGFPSRISVRVWEMRQDAFIYTERKPLFEEGKACRLNSVRVRSQARVLVCPNKT